MPSERLLLVLCVASSMGVSCVEAMQDVRDVRPLDAVSLDRTGPQEASVDADTGQTDVTDVFTPPLTDVSTDEHPVICRPVRHYRRALAYSAGLSCVANGGYVSLLSEAIDDLGDALVVMTFRLVNRAPSTSAHTGIIRMDVGDGSLVGDPNDFFAGLAGDAVCVGQHVDFQLIGYGRLTDSARRFSLLARQYTACAQGQLMIEGVAFEAWVTDVNCPANLVHAWSYQRSVARMFGAGADRPVALTTNVTNMLTQRVVVSQPGVLQVFAQNEATLTPPMVDPPWPPFVCGALVETAASLLQVAGTGIATTQVIERRPFSESQGQTHVFLPNAIRDIAVGAGTFTLETGAAVDQGRNATVTTAGGNSSIDSVLAVVSGAIVERP